MTAMAEGTRCDKCTTRSLGHVHMHLLRHVSLFLVHCIPQDVHGVPLLQELQSRREAWVAPPLKTTNGTLYKYCKLVASASLGCVTDL